MSPLPAPPDIVYPVRKGDWNEELRYSLRSLANLPHGRVWIIGHKPPWVTGVHHWPREQTESKYLNATKALVEVTRELGSSLTSPFLLFNDDYYIMRPMTEVPILNMGPLPEVIDTYRRKHHTGAYWRGMVETYGLLKNAGFLEPLSFELHVPMPMYRDEVLEAWDMGKSLSILHIRTLYGNLAGFRGQTMEDCKVYGKDPPERIGSFLSSNDVILPMLREWFHEKSPYESD